MTKDIYVGFDRDGTLEMPGHPVPARLIEQFESLKKMGFKLFLASGKNYPFLCDIAAEMRLDPWMICAEAGGHIVIPSKNINDVAGAHSDLVLFKEKIHTIELPVHREEPKLSVWSKKFGDDVLEAEARIKKFILDNNWDLVVYSYPDGDGGLDVVPPSIDKTNLLRYLPEKASIYFMGDGDNDLNLLAHERVIPCAVFNAQTTVKNIVHKRKGYMATKPAGEGVAEMLSHLFAI